MGWTTPRTYVTGEIVTASILNTDVRDNLNDIDRRLTAGLAEISTSEGTTSTSYTDLATVGPAVTVTVGASGVVMVIVSCRLFNGTGGSQSAMSYAISGATSQAASSTKALVFRSDSANQDLRASAMSVHTGLNPGATTFTAKYLVTSGSGTFAERALAVVPLGK